MNSVFAIFVVLGVVGGEGLFEVTDVPCVLLGEVLVGVTGCSGRHRFESLTAYQ